MSWQPASCLCAGSSLEASYSFITPVPPSICENEGVECILGVDEAGRGPVLGPMVYGVAYCSVAYADSIAGHGFMDSKVLDHGTRVDLLHRMSLPSHALSREVGWTVRVMSARDIGAGMLRPVAPYNLNAQAHDTTIQLIRDVLAQGVNVRKIFVDTVGIAESYQAMLQRVFPMAQVTVSKKADSIYPIVSVASICAKVTRDKALELAAAAVCDSRVVEADDEKENIQAGKAEANGTVDQTSVKKRRKNEFDSDLSSSEDAQHETTKMLKTEQSYLDTPSIGAWGSGYPSDERTKQWLKDNMDPVFGWRGPVRYSWATVKDLLDKPVNKRNAVLVDWPETEDAEDGQQVLNFSGGRKDGFTVQSWFGKSVGFGGFKI